MKEGTATPAIAGRSEAEPAAPEGAVAEVRVAEAAAAATTDARKEGAAVYQQVQQQRVRH